MGFGHANVLRLSYATVKDSCGYKQIHVSPQCRMTQVLFILFLMTILSQALLALMSRNLVSFSLSTTRHNVSIYLFN